MHYNPNKGHEIEGHLDIFVAENKGEFEGQINRWQEVLIHGTPEGLRSFAKLLLRMSYLNQEEVPNKYLPIGAREHYDLRPGIKLSDSFVRVIVGRLDAKGTREFYKRFAPKKN